VDAAPRLAWRLLRLLSAVVLLALLAAGGRQMLRWEPEYLPIRVVTVDGELKRLSPQRLQETVIDHLHGGIVTQDLATLKQAVEALAWVRSASLRRLWPDHLELTVVEHEPLARWGGDGLVSAEGAVFRPPSRELPSRPLPLLEAADAHAEELVGRLLDWRPRFAALGLGVEAVSMDARGAWTLTTDAGFDLALGKLQVEERVSRFLSAWPSLALVGRPETVDMRYSNGLALTWNMGEGDEDAAAGAKAQARLGPAEAPAEMTLAAGNRGVPPPHRIPENPPRAAGAGPQTPRS
jgi:cell division protein FtsQ